MTPKLKISFSIALVFLSFGAMAQVAAYRYRSKIKGVTSNWHSVKLPNTIFSATKPGLEDLRIYGFNHTDTIEIPYILEKSANQIVEKEIAFVNINESHNNQGYYFTFQINELTIVNQILLSFAQSNFDWKASLEGSNNNNNWFKIITDQRILSIKNPHTDYRFTQIDFPASKYKYFRIQVKANEMPRLNAVKILKTDTLKGISQPINHQSFRTSNNRKTKETVVEVTLPTITPLADLRLETSSKSDFYRPISISYAVDSTSTDEGIRYSYINFFEGTISSIRPLHFDFNGILAKKLKIIIQNNDNEPLQIKSAILMASVYELTTRFQDPNYQYWLYFGNTNANAAIYELKNFENKIPLTLSALTLEKAQSNPTYKTKDKPPFFKSSSWIWSLMGLIILLLGFFTIKMLRETK